MHVTTPAEVIAFWFEKIDSKHWWSADPEFDAMVREKFASSLLAASSGECFSWRSSPLGRLAEIIVLDQFSRNIHRGTPGAFAADGIALVLAEEAVALNAHLALPVEQRAFLLMPFMHSESRLIHVEAERLFREHTSENSFRFELRHKAIVDRFGRYPHRNAILGRVSTAEEAEFLTQPGSRF